MKHLVVVAATDEYDLITFSVIHKQKELLYGRLRWKWFGDSCDGRVDITVNCYQRPQSGERFDSTISGYYEAIVKADDWLGNKREQIEDEFIKKAIYRAIPDSKVIGRIINI